jgi:hypothetical protein
MQDQYLKVHPVPRPIGQPQLKLGREPLGRRTDRGYRPADDRATQIVVWLAPYHKDHTFRYKETGYLTVPTAEDLVTIFRSMHLEIEATVRAAYLKAEASQRPNAG